MRKERGLERISEKLGFRSIFYRGVFSIAAECEILKSLKNEIYRLLQGAKNPCYPQKHSYFRQGSLKCSFLFPFINRRILRVIDTGCQGPHCCHCIRLRYVSWGMSPGFAELRRALCPCARCPR